MSELKPPSNLSDDNPSADRLTRLVRDMDDIKPEVYGDKVDSFVVKTRELMEHFDVRPTRVLYPGSAAHAGIAVAFGKDKVIHLDPDADSIDLLSRNGYLAVVGKKEDFQSDEPFDLIVSRNAGVLEREEIDQLLTPDGYVLANNWHGSANRMSEYSDFKLLGAVLPSLVDGEVVEAAKAADGLGVTRTGITSEGGIVFGADIDEATMTVLNDEKSPDGLFLFQRVEH